MALWINVMSSISTEDESTNKIIIVRFPTHIIVLLKKLILNIFLGSCFENILEIRCGLWNIINRQAVISSRLYHIVNENEKKKLIKLCVYNWNNIQTMLYKRQWLVWHRRVN